jgi:hypothetical protein
MRRPPFQVSFIIVDVFVGKVNTYLEVEVRQDEKLGLCDPGFELLKLPLG